MTRSINRPRSSTLFAAGCLLLCLGSPAIGQGIQAPALTKPVRPEPAADSGSGLDPPPAAEASAASAMRSEIETRTEQLGAIEEQLTKLQQELTARREQRDALYAELERSERDIAALASAGRQLATMVDQQRQTVRMLGGRLDQTRYDLATAQSDLAELLRSAYAMGSGDRLRMLLNREDLARSGRVFGYYRCLGRTRAERIDEVERLAAELEAVRADAAIEAQRLQRLAERQAQTRSRLERAQRKRNAIVADLDANIAKGLGEVASLDADAQSLRALIERLGNRVQIAAEIDLEQADIASRKGKLSWPIANARLVTRFHPARGGGDDLHADGVLIAANKGSEVHAVHQGRVVYADWLRGFGLLLVIDHGDGYMTLYGHNQTLLKEVGEWIGSGEVIALSGASGGSGSPGLYFALRFQGEPQDPEPWCGNGRG